MANSHSSSTNHFLVTISVVVFFACCMATSTVAAGRPLSSKASTLVARLKLDDGGSSTKCWDSLFELQSCTGEVILFFLNGETYLGPACCDAIRNIEHQCWPSMLGVLGYTSQEGDLLVGYCDGSGSHDSSPPPPTNITTATIGVHA